MKPPLDVKSGKSTTAINYVVYGISQCKAFDAFKPRGYVEPILYTIIDPLSALCI